MTIAFGKQTWRRRSSIESDDKTSLINGANSSLAYDSVIPATPGGPPPHCGGYGQAGIQYGILDTRLRGCDMKP
jgi:hypothetical protein